MENTIRVMPEDLQSCICTNIKTIGALHTSPVRILTKMVVTIELTVGKSLQIGSLITLLTHFLKSVTQQLYIDVKNDSKIQEGFLTQFLVFYLLHSAA